MIESDSSNPGDNQKARETEGRKEGGNFEETHEKLLSVLISQREHILSHGRYLGLTRGVICFLPGVSFFPSLLKPEEG